MKYLAAAVLCLSAHQLVFSQELEMPRRSCRECVITKTYNPGSNSTVLLLKLMTVADVNQGKMYLSLATSSRPNDPGTRKVVSLGITFIAPQLIEARDPTLRAEADAKAINFGRLARSNVAAESTLKISSYDGLGNPDDVLRLAQGREVEMIFDGIEFRLTDEHKAAILDFLAYSEPEQAGLFGKPAKIGTRVQKV